MFAIPASNWIYLMQNKYCSWQLLFVFCIVDVIVAFVSNTTWLLFNLHLLFDNNEVSLIRSLKLIVWSSDWCFMMLLTSSLIFKGLRGWELVLSTSLLVLPMIPMISFTESSKQGQIYNTDIGYWILCSSTEG